MGNWEEIGKTPRKRKILRKGDRYRIQSGHHFKEYSTGQLDRVYRVLESSDTYLSTRDIAARTKLRYGDIQERLYVLMANGKIRRKLREGRGPGREYAYFLPESKLDRRPWAFTVELKNGTIVNVHNLNMHGAKGVVYLFNQDWFQRVDVREIEGIEIKKIKPMHIRAHLERLDILENTSHNWGIKDYFHKDIPDKKKTAPIETKPSIDIMRLSDTAIVKIRCPECWALNAKDMQYCRECGYSFYKDDKEYYKSLESIEKLEKKEQARARAYAQKPYCKSEEPCDFKVTYRDEAKCRWNGKCNQQISTLRNIKKGSAHGSTSKMRA